MLKYHLVALTQVQCIIDTAEVMEGWPQSVVRAFSVNNIPFCKDLLVTSYQVLLILRQHSFLVSCMLELAQTKASQNTVNVVCQQLDSKSHHTSNLSTFGTFLNCQATTTVALGLFFSIFSISMPHVLFTCLTFHLFFFSEQLLFVTSNVLDYFCSCVQLQL